MEASRGKRMGYSGSPSSEIQVGLPGSGKRGSIRMYVALLIGPAAWLIPHQGIFSTLMQQRVAELAPVDKVPIVALITSVSMIIAAVFNIVFGACSDLTRSRWGKRTPLILLCSVLGSAVLLAVAYASAMPVFIMWLFVYEMLVNGVASAMMAWLPDMFGPEGLGKASSIYGIGATMGNQASGIIAAALLSNVRLGFLTMSAINLCGAVIACLLMREASNLRAASETGQAPPRVRLWGTIRRFGCFIWRAIRTSFAFPVRGASNFYKCAIGRLVFGVAGSLVMGYRVYILTDYMHAENQRLQYALSVISTIMLVEGVVFCLIAGFTSGTVRRQKHIVVISTLAMGVGSFLPFISADLWTFYVYAVIGGIASGLYTSANQALSMAVLPDHQHAAKDLGVMNIANTLGAVFGALVAVQTISLFGYRGLFPTALILLVISAAIIMRVKVRA